MSIIASEICEKVIALLEMNDAVKISKFAYTLESEQKYETAAYMYIAYLLILNKPFPKAKKITQFSKVLDDNSVFFPFYRVASSGGYTISVLRSLYENMVLPDMVITKKEEANTLYHAIQKKESSNMINVLKQYFSDLGYHELKPGMTPCLSNEAKRLKKQGAIIKSYKIICKRKSFFINAIFINNTVSYDINSLHCENEEKMIEEFKNKMRN